MPDDSNENKYFIDIENASEMARLIQLDMFITRSMGGSLAEQPDPSRFEQILDIGCGPGGWALDVAHTYPKTEVAGIDISTTMIPYANARARSQGLSNASFEVMNMLKPLDFSDNTFDFVNTRLLAGAIPASQWPSVMQECFRITKPGGVMRLGEIDYGGVTNSLAFQDFGEYVGQGMKRAGYGFSIDGRSVGITPMLPSLLHDAGYRNIQIKPIVIDFSSGAEMHMAMYRNYEIFSKVIQPFIANTGVVKIEVLEELYQQLLIDMMQDDFKAMWYLLMAWGEKPR